jgi:uncharacterized protein YjbI with pentapeptide repeats
LNLAGLNLAETNFRGVNLAGANLARAFIEDEQTYARIKAQEEDK